jgi:hypothetical protein
MSKPIELIDRSKCQTNNSSLENHWNTGKSFELNAIIKLQVLNLKLRFLFSSHQIFLNKLCQYWHVIISVSNYWAENKKVK